MKKVPLSFYIIVALVIFILTFSTISLRSCDDKNRRENNEVHTISSIHNINF